MARTIAAVMALIVNELITNALRYGRPRDALISIFFKDVNDNLRHASGGNHIQRGHLSCRGDAITIGFDLESVER
jgi:two-component sensor histidine kinase